MANQTQKMRALVQVTADDDPQKPDFYFRLGELYGEKQRYFFDQAHALDQKIFELPPAQRGPLQATQQRYLREEQTWMLEAVKAYIAATRFPKYERMDEVLFRLATQLTTAKKDDQARGFLQRLIKDYPTSKYIPDAYLAFAEHAFEGGEMEAALRFYEKVEQFPKSSVYPYAVYKKGWCYVNLGDYKTALETFVGVVRLTQTGSSPAIHRAAAGDRWRRRRRRTSSRRTRRSAAPTRRACSSRKVGGDYAPKMMELLAERYWEDGKAPESTRVYKQIIADNMDSPRVCEWQSKVLRNSLSLPNYDKALVTQELERLGLVYEQGAAHEAANRRRSAGTRFTTPRRELALIWHREAQKTQDMRHVRPVRARVSPVPGAVRR